MENGLHGPAGLPVQYPVEAALDREQETAQIHSHSMAGTNVKETTYR